MVVGDDDGDGGGGGGGDGDGEQARRRQTKATRMMVNLPRVTAQGGVIMAVYDEDGGQVDLTRVAAQGGRWEARTTRKKGDGIGEANPEGRKWP